MPVVRLKDLDASNDNSPHTANVTAQIDLALLLSEHYGRNIRQGNSFKVNGVQAWLRPADLNLAEGIDSGVSAAVKFAYIPATGHSRRAWNNVFKQWKAQKNLAGAVGTQIRYDDMEFAWNSGLTTSRTSTLYSTGIGDSDTEHLVLTGQSTGGDDFSLEDYYNSSYETPAASRNHFSNAVIKAPKFGDTPFPAIQNVYCSAINSARLGNLGYTEIPALPDLTPEGLTSAVADSEMNMLPTPIHVLCGIMEVKAYIMPDDTVDQVEEDMAMDIAISVVSWKPLVYRPRRKTGRKSSKKGGGRSGTRSTSKNSRS
jgi:hypothetical protein